MRVAPERVHGESVCDCVVVVCHAHSSDSCQSLPVGHPHIHAAEQR